MRHFKRLVGIACAVLALGFIGCANDDDDDDETPAAAITLSCAVTTVEQGTAITGTVSFSNFATTPTAVDVYVEGVTDAVASGVAVTSGTFTLDTADFDADTYKVYVKSGSVESNHISVTITAPAVAATKTAPDAVGDIVLSDGTAVAAENAASMSDAQKAAALAVIFYAGSADDALGEKVLGVGLQNTRGESTTTLAWCTISAEGCSTNITALQCTPSASGSGAADTATFTGTTDGSGNWASLCAAVSDEDTSGNYPAWEWVNAYVANNGLSSTSYAENWYLPSIAELTMLYRAKTTVNASLAAAGGTELSSYYWSSSQSASYDGYAWELNFGSGLLYDGYEGNSGGNGVCCIRAFN